MKKSFIIPLALVGLLTASCNFLNVDDYFEDTFSEERIFESQYNIERYFNGAVNQLPKEGRIAGILTATDIVRPRRHRV